LTVFSIKSYAQNASIILTSINNDNSFRVTINKVIQNQYFTNFIEIDSLNGNQYYHLSISFKNDSLVLQKDFEIIDDGFTQFYSISKEGIFLKKIVASQLISKDELPKTIFHYKNNNTN